MEGQLAHTERAEILKGNAPNDLAQSDATVEDDESARDDAAKDLDRDVHAVAGLVVERGEDAHEDKDDELDGYERHSLNPAVILRWQVNVSTFLPHYAAS